MELGVALVVKGDCAASSLESEATCETAGLCDSPAIAEEAVKGGPRTMLSEVMAAERPQLVSGAGWEHGWWDEQTRLLQE